MIDFPGMMTITPTTEDYLQAIVALIEEGQPVIAARLAERLKVSPASVSQTVERMVRLNLLEIGEGHRISFTASGQKAADAIVRRHRLTERFLCDVLNLGWVEAHEQAHQLEHGLTDLIESRISELLGTPKPARTAGPSPATSRRAATPLGRPSRRSPSVEAARSAASPT